MRPKISRDSVSWVRGESGLISAFAAVQVVVHMIFFLHMNGKVEGGWNLLALIFTAIVVLIVLSGSLWVMYHLQANMMPTMAQMQNLPG